jgi:2,3,4,5-tetrahydropyridine-2-carboxylate N-succinyltransferase
MTSTTRSAWGVGLATLTDDGQVLDTWYPAPVLGGPSSAPEGLEKLAGHDEARRVRREVVERSIDLDAAPADACDAYLRLHLLSHRLIAPHGCDLTGLFGLLTNVVWTTAGPCAVEGFEATRMRLLAKGPVQVSASTSSRVWSTTCCPPGCGSPTPTGCASAPTWPWGRPSCTRAS